MFLPNFLPGYGAVTVASLVATGAIAAGGTIKGAKIRASTAGSASDVSFGWDISGRADNDRNGRYMDSSNDNMRDAASGALVFVCSSSGVACISSFTVNNGATIDGGDLTMATGRAIVLWAGTASDCSVQWTGDPNTGMYYTSADRYELAANGGDTMSIRNQLAVSYISHQLNTISGVAGNLITVASPSNLKLAGGYIELSEIAAPGADGADTARIYATVAGALTNTSVVFQDGTVAIFATEV